MRKKTLFFAIMACISAVCLLLSACSGSSKNGEEEAQQKTYNDPTPEQDHPETEILFLGDSIAEGILGPSPVIERERYSYAGIVGTINGFTYRNRSVSGHKSYQLRDFIAGDEDDNAFAVISHIKTADVISISILGNDLLQSYFDRQMQHAMDGDFSETDNILAESYENLDAIVRRIRELNPDVTLFCQTVYNPVYSYATLVGEDTKEYIKSKGYTESDYHEMTDLVIGRMNDVFRRYLKNNPDAFYLLDVHEKFDEIYAGNDLKLDRLIYADCTHPSNEGHATIAALIQEKLEELGIADHAYALANYKSLCVGRLRDLYTGTSVDVEKTVENINAATSYYAVNDAYFDATYNVTPKYEVYSGVKTTGEEEVYETYRFSDIKGIGRTITSLIDLEESYIKIQVQGGNKFEVKLKPNDIAFVGAATLLAVFGGDIDVSAGDIYVDELFPTESLSGFASLLARMKYDLGVSFEGLDPEKEEVKALIESVEKNRIVPANVQIPEDFALCLSGWYERKTIKNETGEDFDAAYLGSYNRNGETYLVFTFGEKEGKKTVRIQNDVLMLIGIAELEEAQEPTEE